MPYLLSAFGPLAQCTQVGAARTTARTVFYSPLTGQVSAQTDWLNISGTASWTTGMRASSDGAAIAIATGYAALETPFGPAVWSTQYRDNNSEGRAGVVNLITGQFYPGGNGAWLPTVPAAGGAAVESPATAGMAIRHTGAAPPADGNLLSMQVNLCSGGTDATRDRCGVTGAVNETRALINENRPELVTLNESCEPDVINRLFTDLLNVHPDEWQFWSFVPATNRPTSQPVRCEDANDNPVRGRYGNSVIGRLFAPLAGGPHLSHIGLQYPKENGLQNPDSPELRSWVCVDVNHRHWGCTTHLDSRSAAVALDQCEYLTGAVIPFIKAAQGTHPTVMAGDLNLRFDPGDDFDVQQCVPAGWFRVGDGSLQHTMATDGYRVASSRRVPLDGSDHDAWLVELTRIV
jgi:hypothetical protein